MTHTHTDPFNGHFSRWTWVSWLGKRWYRPQTISATNDIGHKDHRPQHAPYQPHTMSISATS